MIVRKIDEMPIEYYSHPRAVLCINMTAQCPAWFICIYDQSLGEWMVAEREECFLDPTHYCELPELPCSGKQ